LYIPKLRMALHLHHGPPLAIAAALVLSIPTTARSATPPDGSRVACTAGACTAGAWIWTRADAHLLDRARATDPGLRAAVHVATISRRADGTLARSLALSPDVAGDPGQEAAALIRFDDSLHDAWSATPTDAVTDAAASMVADIVARVDESAMHVAEIQLDYDAPVRALGAWAGVVHRLTEGPLHGRDVWITSIPAHVEAPSYGALFAGAGVGHILQVFDTGLDCTPAHAERLAARLVAAGLRFRVGVGGFERAAHPGAHECWRAAAAGWRGLPGYAGVWVFPAARDIRRSLALFEVP
jgi:hypothetical protein